MNAVVSAFSLTRSTTSPFRWPFLILGLALLAIFAGLTFYAVGHPYMPFDVSIERSIQSINWGPLVPVFKWFDELEGPRQLFAGIAVIALVAVVSWRKAPLMVVAALSGPIYTVLQGIIQRPRPSSDLVNVIRHTSGYSFPSGHIVFFSWVLVLLVVCLGVGRLPRPLLAVAWIAAAAVLLVACVGRIYFGEHWPSDVLGGLLVGVSWSALSLALGRLTDPVFRRAPTG